MVSFREYGLEPGLYRASLNLPPPAMLFSNGEEHPSTASSPQSTPETPDSNSSDIAEPNGQFHHNWNSWNTLSTANNQITLEDIIHESAMIECVPAKILPPFALSTLTLGQGECVPSACKFSPCLSKFFIRP